MATMTIRMSDEKAERLKTLAQHRGMSVNKLFEEWATMGIAEFDSYVRFQVRAARGSRERGLATLRMMQMRDDSAQSGAQGARGFHDQAQAPFEPES